MGLGRGDASLRGWPRTVVDPPTVVRPRRGPWRLGVLLSLVLPAAGCSTDGDAALAGAIAEVVQRGDGAVLRMADLTEFPWDRLYVFVPYTTPAQIERELGLPCPWTRRASIESRDDVALLLFVHDGRVTRHLAQRRGKGDFTLLRRAGGYAKDEAVFEVDRRRGWVYLVWRPGIPAGGGPTSGEHPSESTASERPGSAREGR
jgi:hypothetical protein